MGQLDFLATWEDSWGIVQTLLAETATVIVPDLKYEEPKPDFVRHLDANTRTLIQSRRSVFLWSPDFSAYDPYLEPIQSGVNAGRFSIDGSRGGPLLHLVLPAAYVENAKLMLAPGMLALPRTWLNPETNKWEKPTSELKDGFKEIVRIIKSQLVRHDFHLPIWIGRDALAKALANEAVIRGFGLD